MEEIAVIVLALFGILIIVRCNLEMNQEAQSRARMTEEKLDRKSTRLNSSHTS